MIYNSRIFFYIVLALAAASDVLAAGSYTLTNIGALASVGPADFSYAAGLSSYGQVVGSSYISPVSNHGILWTPTTANAPTGALQDLGVLSGAPSSNATGINPFGQVVGASGSGPVTNAFLWQPTSPNATTGSMTGLGALPGAEIPHSLAYGINLSGQITGEAGAPGFLLRAMLWSPSSPNGTTGSMVNLGALSPTAATSSARAINPVGQVVGQSAATGGGQRAFIWNPTTPNGTTGSMFDMGELPGGSNYSAARDINAQGQVVGESNAATGLRAFLWTPSSPNGAAGSMVDLGDLSGGTDSSSAAAMDSAGRVVGTSSAANGSDAFLWTPSSPNGSSGTMIDLNTLLSPADQAAWHLERAVAINEFGQIAGYGQFDPDGSGPIQQVGRGFLLTPVPEPSVVAFMLVAVTMLGLNRKQVRR